MPDNRPNRLSPEKATLEIRGTAKWRGLILTSHIRKRMKQKNYDTQDLDLILSTGQVRKPPEWDSKYEEWKYAVEGNAVEGDKATVIVSIVNPTEIKGITIKPA